MGLTEEGDELEERDELEAPFVEKLEDKVPVSTELLAAVKSSYSKYKADKDLEQEAKGKLRRNWWRCPRCWETCSRQSWAPCSWTAGTTWPPCGAYTPDSAPSSTR